jgi:MYXO-CTERM domain-containing protein
VTSVKLTAHDAAGNDSQPCTYRVTVEDHTPPLLVCPDKVVQEATSAAGAAAYYFVVASDAVSPTVVTATPDSRSVFKIGETMINVTAKAGTLTTSCQIRIIVADTVAPRLTCPLDVVRLATSAEPIPVTYKPLVDDDVTLHPELSSDHPSESLFPVGETLVTVTARDEAGNSSQCTFRVNNVDPVAPTIQCPEPQQVVASKPEGGVVAFPEAVATDNLGQTSVSYSQEPGSTFAVGETIVTATARDLGGNLASCTFTVTVKEGSGSGCGCGAGPSGGGFWWLLLALAPMWARRRAARLAR